MKQEILSITDFNAALRGEIYGWIGHMPSDKEQAEFERYIADYIAECINNDKRPELTGVCVAILECSKESFRQCDDCGDRYLPDEFNSEEWGNYCIHCKPYRDPDGEPGGHDDPLNFTDVG